MKFHEMGLLTARKAGNRVFYRVGGTSDGRPNESQKGERYEKRFVLWPL